VREINSYRIWRRRHKEREICGDINADGGEYCKEGLKVM